MRNWVYKTAWKIDNGEPVKSILRWRNCIVAARRSRWATRPCRSWAVSATPRIAVFLACGVTSAVYRIGAGTDEIMIHIAGRAIQKLYQD